MYKFLFRSRWIAVVWVGGVLASTGYFIGGGEADRVAHDIADRVREKEALQRQQAARPVNAYSSSAQQQMLPPPAPLPPPAASPTPQFVSPVQVEQYDPSAMNAPMVDNQIDPASAEATMPTAPDAQADHRADMIAQ